MKEFKLTTVDSKISSVYLWDNVKDAKCVVQLVHGSGEHMKRYHEFGKFLNKHNIVMVGDDHRGHGKTAQDNNAPLGYFSRHDGWNKIVNDEKSINSFIIKKFPDLPIIMLGHSMGSFIAQDYAIKYSQTIDGLILSGTTEQNETSLFFGKLVAKISRLFNGPKKPSKLIWRFSYKRFNKRFKKKKGNGSEWQTRDSLVQEQFVNDPLTGKILSNSAFFDMFKGLSFIKKKKHIQLMRKDLPILIIAGKDDPVGKYGAGPRKVYEKFKSLNYEPILKIYPEMRHEILFELDKEIVWNDVLNFVKTVIKNSNK